METMKNFIKFKIFGKKLPLPKATSGEHKTAPGPDCLAFAHGFAAGCYDYDDIWYYERCRWQA
jgi:hypothetical protein